MIPSNFGVVRVAVIILLQFSVDDFFSVLYAMRFVLLYTVRRESDTGKIEGIINVLVNSNYLLENENILKFATALIFYWR